MAKKPYIGRQHDHVSFTAAWVRRNEARTWKKLRLVVSLRISQNGELQNHQFRFSRRPTAQCQASGGDDQSLWAEFHVPGVHSNLPCIFTGAGETEAGACRVTRTPRHLRNVSLIFKRSTPRTLFHFPKFSPVIQWEATRSQTRLKTNRKILGEDVDVCR